jgi:hypothetical protein
MGTTFYGKEGSFKPIDAQVNVALNRDAQAAKQEIEGLKLLRDSYDERDSDFINALKNKWGEEKASKDADKTRLDKNFVAQQNAIKRNKDKHRQNLEIELQNIRTEAKGLQAFTQTGTKVLNNLADRQERKINEAATLDFYNKEGDYTDFQADVMEMTFIKAALGTKDLAFLEFYNGGSPEAVSYQNTLPTPLKIAEVAKISADLNNDPAIIKQFFQNRLNQEQAVSYEDKLRLIDRIIPVMLLQQTGLSEINTPLINDFKKSIKKVGIELRNEIKNEHLGLVGDKSIAGAYQYWKGTRGKEVEQGAFNILQSTIANTYKDGVRRGNSGIKNYMKGMLVNPQLVTNDVEYNRILDMKTLPNTDSTGKITQAARPLRQVFSPTELYDMKKERLEAEKDIIETEALKAEIHSKQVKQEVRRAILEDWDASEEMKEKIFATAPGLTEKDKKELEALTVQVSNNTDLVEQRLSADQKIRDGVFFEDDYLMLSPSLRADPKYRKGYKQISEFVAKTGWSKETVTGTFRDFIQNDVLQVINDPAVVTPILNRTIKPAIAEATKDFYRYVSEYMDDPEHAKKGAEHVRALAEKRISDEIISGKGKWRVNDGYDAYEGKTIGDGHFPYFDANNASQHQIQYPLAHTLDLIDEHGSTLLKTDVVLTPAYIMAQEAQLEMGRGFQVTQDVKEIAEKSGLTESEVINQQRAVLGLKGKVDPSVRENVVKSAAQIEQNNAALTKLSKNIRSFDDALKARIAQVEPRLSMAMTSTTRWQAAVKSAGIPIGTYKTVEQLGTFPAGQQILSKYFGPNGNPRGGAVIGSRYRVNGGTRLVIQLPGSDPNEPRHIYLFKGDM